MALHRPRHGSLQFWPRKKARKEIPSVNWKAFENSRSKNRLLGFIAYKVGMSSVLAKDNTQNSLTKGKNIVLPVTLIECPPLKVFSIRYYKNGQVINEVISSSLEKEIKRILKTPKIANKEKAIQDFDDARNDRISGHPKIPEGFDDIRIIAYSLVKKTGIKKTPNIAEIGIKGNAKEKEEFAKSILNKEINFDEFFDKNQLVDIHAVTKGKGLQGPVKRFGIQLKPHKSEKGVRRPGSLGPWHPARVTFRVAMAGQLGYFTRVTYNNKIINLGKDLKDEFLHYGFIKTNYAMIKGSVQGTAKRALMITSSLRPTKKQAKENFEFVRILK